MSLAVKVYEAFKDDERKARALSEVIDELESRTAYLKDITTKGDLEVAKLALQKEIEQVRKELREGELRLQKEIEEVRKELREVELRLQKEIEQVKLPLQREIERVKASVIKWVVGLLLVQTGVIVSIIGLLR